MDNNAIANNFNLLSKLVDIHDGNSFKSKTYSVAAFTIEKLPVQLATLSKEKIFSIKNIGESIGGKILELQQTGSLALLNEYLANTPEGVMEMLKIKGIGPKKIGLLWKEYGIESIPQLLVACKENKLSSIKGFGAKTQQSILEVIEFLLSHEGQYLFAQVESYSANLWKSLQMAFPKNKFSITGDILRQMEIVNAIDLVTTANYKLIGEYFRDNSIETVTETALKSTFKTKDNLPVIIYFATSENFQKLVFEKSCSVEFWNAWQNQFPFTDNIVSEDSIFLNAGTDYIPPYMREKTDTINIAKEHKMPPVLQPNEIKGIIHSHSNWSDGAFDIEEMVIHAIQKKFEYLVLTDHSKSAFYANGLTEERVIAQHKQIDELNEKFAPFKIFKGIESDILNDGSLDYSPDVLSTFDVIIASIHSNQKMEEEKATQRLIKAVENPFTNILGHLTGRLLLKRKGYPVDHKKIIDACAANNVVIELNANPKRLDIDWRWIEYCLEKEVLISIDPDAHSINEFDNVRFGTLIAQKAGLTRFNNLSSFDLNSFEEFLKKQNQKRG